MIVQEQLIDNPSLIKTYSNKGMMIIQDGTGDMYAEAIDLISANHTYTESDIPVNGDEILESQEALEAIFGDFTE